MSHRCSDCQVNTRSRWSQDRKALTLSSAIGNAIVFPLDLVTTRLQHASPNARKSEPKHPLDQSADLAECLQLASWPRCRGSSNVEG